MGANVNWGATDQELFFNDVDTAAWHPFAWKLDPISGHKQRMGSTVYHVSPDGRWLVAANLATTRRTQPGYGCMVPDAKIRRNIGPVDNGGFMLTDTATGQSTLFVTIAELMREADPPVLMDDPDRYEIHGFHSKFSPHSDWLC